MGYGFQMSVQPSVLIIDDDLLGRSSLSAAFSFLEKPCCFFTFVDWLQSVEKSANLQRVSVVFLGQSQLPISLEKLINDLQIQLPNVVVATLGDRSERDAMPEEVKSLLAGHLDLPCTYPQLIDLLHKAQVSQQQLSSNMTSDAVNLFSSLVGASDGMLQVRKAMHQVSKRDVNVLIRGESGTGKEVVARNLHDHSRRKDGPFVPINCGAIPADLLESELFGHEKGAFTGAVCSRAGRFELAKGGTLFLDEIGDMPLPMQVKLLRVLQERKFERIGGTKVIEADIRLVAATHKNLEAMIEAGTFREDLYYRLNVFPIEMPPLSARQGDLPLLIEALISRLKSQGCDPIRFHPSALESLQLHPWPGNVRELANLIERLAIMYPNSIVGVSELPERFRHISEPDPERYQVVENSSAEKEINTDALVMPNSPYSLGQLPVDGVDLKQHLEGIERSLIEQALNVNNGVVARAADSLQIRRTTLVEKMRKYGMQRK